MIALPKTRTRTARAGAPAPKSQVQGDRVVAHAIGFAEAAPAVMRGLQTALAGLLHAAPAEISKAVHVERAFGIDHQTGWQVYQIATAENPLAAAGHVPNRTAVQRLLKSASRKRVDAGVVTRASEAFESFERLVEDHAGDRSTLSTMLGTFLPEERQRTELAGKMAMFKGASQLRGFAIEAEYHANFLHPSANPLEVDYAVIRSVMGLHRVHTGSNFSLGSCSLNNPEYKVLSLERQVLRKADDFLVPEYCTSPLPHFEIREFDGEYNTFIAGNELGLQHAVDITTAEYSPEYFKRYRTSDGRRRTGVGILQDSPLKRLTLDVIIHRDVYPYSTPRLDMYESVTRGIPMGFDDPKRERNKMPMNEKIVALPGDVLQSQLPHLPRQAEMLAHVCEKLGWDPKSFRGYRLDVLYPVYGVSYMVGLELPDPPSASA